MGINILVIAFLMVIVWLSIDYLSADYFSELMEKYHISPASSHAMFVQAAHRYLIWASIGGVLLAGCLSFLLMRHVLNPLIQMTRITHNISAGDYSTKVPTVSKDEVGQLAMAFNRMADDLKRMESLRKRLMIDVAHELRTPLTNMRGYLEALVDGVVEPSRDTFEMLQEETLRLVALTEDILQLAKADAAHKYLAPVEISLNGLIASELNAIRKRFEDGHIKIIEHLSENKVLIWADPHLLGQVVRNLLQNACRYTPREGTLQIVLESTPESVKTIFTNSAGELDEEDIPFLFERFFRGEKSRSRAHGGAGIGLAIVKEIIEAHGGQVSANLSDGLISIAFTLSLQR